MKLKLRQACPQCGAPLELWETDRLLSCSYCGVKTYLWSQGPFRYTLPLGNGLDTEGVLVQVPYLRFKGAVYWSDGRRLHYRLIDTTRLLHGHALFPPTLGLRPQAMKLHRLSGQTRGSFLPRTIPARVVLEESVGTSGPIASQEKRCIGETVSVIYLPVLVKRYLLVDGVTGEKIGRLPAGTTLSEGISLQQQWLTRFLPALCPRCGWNLEAESDGVVSFCSNCLSAYQLQAGRLHALSWSLAAGDGAVYLPFWRIRCSFPSLALASFADLLRQTNQPVVIDRTWQRQPLQLFLPACKLRPDLYLRLGKQVTLGQHRLQAGKRAITSRMFPVTLPAREAQEALSLLLAAMAVEKKKIPDLLRSAPVFDGEPELLFLPCVDRQHDWQQPSTGAVIAKTILRVGRNL